MGQWEGIAERAPELNKEHGHFWFLTQKFALEAAIIGVCKLYDDGNKKHSGHTVGKPLIYLTENLTLETCLTIEKTDLTALTIKEDTATRIISDFRDCNHNFEDAKQHLIRAIEQIIPNKESDPHLKKIFTFRNKVVAHQEQLAACTKDDLKDLPPLEEMTRLNERAFKFCQFFAHVFVPNTDLGYPSICARMITLNVVKRYLKIDFSNHEQETAFYARPL